MSYKTFVTENVNPLKIRLSLHLFDNGYNYACLSSHRTGIISSSTDYYLPGSLEPGFSKS